MEHKHDEFIKYRRGVQRRLTITIITPAILKMEGDDVFSEVLEPIRVIGGLDDSGVFKTIRDHYPNLNVVPYQVDKYSELYEMTLKEFTTYAQLKEKTKIKGGIY